MTPAEIREVADNIKQKDVDFGPQAIRTLACLEIAAQLADLNNQLAVLTEVILHWRSS